MADSDLSAYAASRGLTLVPGKRLPRTTPLLAEGRLRSVDAVLSGWLATYVEAQIAVVGRDEGSFTIAVTHVPKAKRFAPWMLCHRVEDDPLLSRIASPLLAGGGGRVELESAELDRQYRVYASSDADQVWVRELFSPSFIVFLIERAPSGLSFEYVDGSLCVSLPGSRTLDEDLDGLRDATVALVGRLRAEVREALGREQGRSAPGPTGFPPADR